MRRITPLLLLVALLAAPAASLAAGPAAIPAAGQAATPAAIAATDPFDLLSVMREELDRSLANFAEAEGAPLYHLQYSVTDLHDYSLSVTDGGLNAPEQSGRRYLDVDLRVGSMELDNTHEIRGDNWRDNYTETRLVDFPVDDHPAAVRAALWNETEYQFLKAQERLTKVLANRQVKVEEQDLSNDFSPGDPHVYSEPPKRTDIDEGYWSGVLSRVGDYLAGHDFVTRSSASISVTDRNNYMVSSEGSALQHGNTYLRVTLMISGIADDGMSLRRSEYWAASTTTNLPDEATVMENARRIVSELDALRNAPVVEPYIGPAILTSRAAGVFFHEIFGHRIEGHRQKSESEGQTFTRKVNQQILPEFISVYDDPTLPVFRGTDLRGHYRYDDEGTPSERVTVVDRGVLRNFLTSRSPIEGFPRSNGHGRREHGNDVVARQGNLIIESEKTVPYARLRQMLIEECRRQKKPYGLIFDDISGGFTMTGRGGPQAFKVLPLLVTRVYADGRPDEVVRGVDIVGTPLTSFSKIAMAADDPGVFNGTCGAESGWCPVSGISPSLLVTEIEVEKRPKGQDRPPILPTLAATAATAATAAAQDDVLFGAMQDEMDRSMSDLRIEGMNPPYFLSYRLQDDDVVGVEARYGSLVRSEATRARNLYVECRVGGPSFDNSNFVAGWQDLNRQRQGVVEEDHYGALRHSIWLATDAAYKAALEQLAGKESYLRAHPQKEAVPDFSAAEPFVHIEEPVALSVDTGAWEDEARAAAAVLAGYPALQDWRVAFTGVASTKRYVNSEGSRHLKGAVMSDLEITATAQADDGQRLTAFLRYSTSGGDALPTGQALVAAVRGMAEEFEALRSAGTLDEYAGPVLFADYAAAQLVAQLFAAQLAPARSPLLADDWMKQYVPDAKLAGKLSRRVLPEFVTVTDEPTRESWEGMRLAGYRLVDDEGVPAENVTLVESGRLVTLPIGRGPTKKLTESNGRAVAF
ncbi:MAG: hypothetical protein FJY74_08705, partial [Candidatus Eisenbacteria bacterium]|nr:hypothetical protein [Candidatus Eisenbacteria bacterium]